MYYFLNFILFIEKFFVIFRKTLKFWAKNAQLKEQTQAPQGSVLVWKSVTFTANLQRYQSLAAKNFANWNFNL